VVELLRIGETDGMNSTLRHLLLLVLLGLESLVITGCANTGRGMKADYQHNEDKVENAVKH
jgi:predicted small secreted protein